VFAVFATGDVVALSSDGKVLWTRSLGTPSHTYGYGSSPAFVGDLLIVQFDQEENGRLIALEGASGRIRWETPRRVQASWASPVIADSAEGAQLVVNGNPFLAAYDAVTGAELWQVKGMLGEIAPSPAFSDGRIFAGNQLLNLIGVDAATRKVLWEMYDDIPDVSSPLAAQGMVLTAASFGVVTCLDAAGGSVLWKQEFPKGFYASPVLAGGRFYLLDRSGVMRILAAAREPKLLGSPSVGEPTDATPAFRGGRIYIRGTRHLFCIGARDG
jgi:outer membrane protein assembly factor BamB